MYKYPKVWNRSETGLKQAWNRPTKIRKHHWRGLSLTFFCITLTSPCDKWLSSKRREQTKVGCDHSLEPQLRFCGWNWLKRHPRPQKSDSRCFFFFLDGAFLVLHHQGEKCQNRREWTSLHWLLIFQLVKSLFEQNQGSETALNPRNSAHAPQQQPPN